MKIFLLHHLFLLLLLLLVALALLLLALGVDLALGLLLRELLSVVSLQLLENGVVIEQSVEFELTSWAILVVEGPIEVLLLRGVNQEIKLRNHDTAYDLFFIHNFNKHCFH